MAVDGKILDPSKTSCALSVILPVYNAMPWLPIAVRDMLKQVPFVNARLR